jgi:hypothetical protein
MIKEADEFLSNPISERDDQLQELISTLSAINFQIAELQRIKEALEPRVASLLQHGDEGSKTYVAGKYKVTCKTGWIYSLDKEEYEINKNRLSKGFNVVRERVAYDIDKNVLKDIEKYGSVDDLNVLATFVSKKPSKLNVKITAGI